MIHSQPSKESNKTQPKKVQPIIKDGDYGSEKMSILCGAGVFDWSDSKLMEDVQNNKVNF